MFSSLLCLASKARDSIYARVTRSFERGDYAMMLEYSLEGLYLTEKGACSERSYANLKVGHSYYYLQQKQAAIQYLKSANLIAKDCPEDSILHISYRQIGSIYIELQKNDSARYYLQQAEILLINTPRWKELSALYDMLGVIETKKTGINYFDLAEEYAIKSNDTIQIAFANVKQGEHAAWQKKHGKAEVYLRKALGLYRSQQLVEGEMYALVTLAHTLSERGKAKEVFTVYKQYQTLRDSIFRKETAEKTAHYRTLYETEKKERENNELIKNRRLLLAGSAIVLLLTTLIFYFIYSRYRLKKQREIDRHTAEQEQLRFQAVIEAEEKERKRIASDLHDGVGQTMSAAKINLSMLQNELVLQTEDQKSTLEKIVALVDESCREVRSVSHNMMPNTLLKSGLASAIRNFINQIDRRILRVDFYSEGLDAPLRTNYEVVLYRVVQECVNNVIKHSGASTLHISLIKDEEGVSVTVEDNGKGFDTSKTENFDGIGLKNIQSRINYLKGTVEWSSAIEKGTAVIINIPA